MVSEQQLVRTWAWQRYGVLVRALALPWPPGVDALTVCDGDAPRVWYRADCPRWRSAVCGELAALVGME